MIEAHERADLTGAELDQHLVTAHGVQPGAPFWELFDGDARARWHARDHRPPPPAPVPPEDVRVRYTDGRPDVPCALDYDGPDDDGIHQWTATPQEPVALADLIEQRATLHPGMLPARTAVGIAVVALEGPQITCPRCGMTSHHPTDVAEGYCGNCHDYTGRDHSR